ncbi:MAG: S9 family peptidase [Planctomycetota bacterium]|nr:MAG: S9 family peptidase [Planctomycetota bacterium]
MRPSSLRFPAVAVTLAAVLAACALAPDRNASRPAYPEAPRNDTVDVYHGVRVADAYRPLEDPDAPETRAWIEAENALTGAYLEAIPERDAIRARLTALWDYERFGLPQKRGERLFYTRNDGLQNQSVLYVEDPGAPARVLLDPNALSADGTIALGPWEPSEDGRYVAYALADGGSDWTDWYVLDADTGQPTGDHLTWIKFVGVAWKQDGSGFFYARYPAPPGGDRLTAVNENQELYFHALGQPQERDVLVWKDPEHPKWEFQPYVSDDGQRLLVQVGEGTDPRSRWWMAPVQTPAALTPLLNEFDASYELAGTEGSTLYFRSDNAAPRGRVIAVDANHPEPAHWKEIVPQSADTLRGVRLCGGMLLCHWLQDAHSRVTLHDLDGGMTRWFAFTEPVTVTGISGRHADPQIFYSYASFTAPERIFTANLDTRADGPFRTPELDFDAAEYVTEQVWYTSKDGTRVPMYLVHKKGLQRNGRNPTYLYGYGGFNVAITPTFSVPNAVWLEMGGLLAVANLRGGGEFGEEWHQAGTVHNKQNVFDDFIAAAEWLVAEKWTAPDKLAIGGRSNGGLLVGACITQRPDLFGAALPGVGVLDMLRYHRFTIGWAWASDYGTSDDPEQFASLYAYSPLHNLKPGAHYPATLITTADHDDRVVPAHSFKFAAALQAAQGGPEPVLIRIDTRAGHGAGKPISKSIAEWADLWGFLVRELGVRLEG